MHVYALFIPCREQDKCSAAHDYPAVARWVIDLRANRCGDSWTMFAALAPLLSLGRQIGFLNSSDRFIPVDLPVQGVVIGGNLVAHRDLDSVIGNLAESPALVWTGPACDSSCEAVAIALSDWPHTKMIGLPCGLVNRQRGYRHRTDSFRLFHGRLNDACGWPQGRRQDPAAGGLRQR